jgi:hypothetical protein
MEMPDETRRALATLSASVQSLQRRQARLTRAFAAALLIVIAFAIIGWSDNETVLTANALVLKDKAGVVKAQIYALETGGYIWLYDREGKNPIRFGWNGEDRMPMLEMSFGKVIHKMYFNAKGLPLYFTGDPAGRFIQLGYDEQQTAALAMFEGAKPAAVLAVKDSSYRSLRFFKDGKVVWSTP